MPRDIISRYIWIIDTLSRYGRLTRREISRLWERSAAGDGRPIPERTFYNYRRAIEQNFNIDILCNAAGEYYIDERDSHSRAYTNWLLDAYSVNSALKESNVAGERIDIEDVPSAREFLPTVLEAISGCRKVEFTYAGFSRSREEADIVFHPYFVKRYKQRWYMIGFKEKSAGVRTYALDRVKKMTISGDTFDMPEDCLPGDVFGNVIGVTDTLGDVKRVRLKVSHTQAKYLRALPLHVSQTEEAVHDRYSIFAYRLKLNYELVHEILGMGAGVMVLDPPELKAMVVTELKATLSHYDGNGDDDGSRFGGTTAFC